MRLALYARVSTRDKDQDPETQLHRLRQVVAQHADWTVVGEYTDHAIANDLRGRTAWRRLLEELTGCRAALAGSGSTWFVAGSHPAPGLVVVRVAAPPPPVPIDEAARGEGRDGTRA